MKFTKFIVASLLVAGCALSASAAVQTTSNVIDQNATLADKEANRTGNLPYDGNFVGGENIGSAVAIGSLPFSDDGNTCGYADDYDEVCPYTGSLSGDVVYSLSPGADTSIQIDLCSSLYDTKVFVYENFAGNTVACNDDAGCGFSGYQSFLPNVPLTAGNTYYIVIDGWASDCGDYFLNIIEPQPCGGCPEGAQVEGEPVCGDNYVDAYNGGCNSVPPVYSNVDCGVICGEGGTYSYFGSSYRDTDWYTLSVPAGSYQFFGMADGFTLRLFLLAIPGGNCGNLQILDTQSAPSCVETPHIFFNGPADYVLFAGTDSFSGVPCGSDYVIRVIDSAGNPYPPCGAVPTVETSWGAVKGLYR